MALAFICKECGTKYRNVSKELSGRKIRCECGRVQRLMTREHIERRKRRKKKKKKRRPVELEDVYDLTSQSVILSSNMSAELREAVLVDPEHESELGREKDIPTNSKDRESVLPTFPSGYIRSNMRMPYLDEIPRPSTIKLLGFCGGLGSILTGIVVGLIALRVIMAGETDSSFIDPVLGLKITLTSMAGIRLIAFGIIASAIGMLIGGIAQFASAIATKTEQVGNPLWPNQVVAASAFLFLVLICFSLFTVNRVKNTKLSLREASITKSTSAAENRGNPLDASFVDKQKSELQAIADRANLGVRELFLKCCPFCLMAIVIGVLGFQRYQKLRLLTLLGMA